VNYERVLVFGAHHDDEITMAGTIAKLSAAGVQVVVAIFTDGCEGYPRPEMKATIVETRRKEAEACNAVLGIACRVYFDRPDMGLVNDKQTLQDAIRVIREVRPDAIFTHGPEDRHRDHVNTSNISTEAWWHAGEPVAAELGERWSTPHLYYYKGVVTKLLPSVVYDVSETAYKRPLALATQVSQHTLFGRTAEEFRREAERIRTSGETYTERFWIVHSVTLGDFLPKGL
jgi:LmbE family N-acetylglucosaminyl deacetylase